MARDAADVVFRVYGIYGVHVLLVGGMTGQTARVDFLGGVILEDENLRLVTGVSEVGKSGAVTALAALTGRAALRVEGRLPVRRFFPALIEIFMTGFADLGT